MRKLQALIVLAVVIAGFEARPAAGVTVYDNFVGGAYDAEDGWAATGTSFRSGFNNLEAAMPFSPSERCTFVSAVLAVGLNSGTNSFEVTLAAYNPSAPDTPGATIEDLAAAGEVDGLLTVDSTAHPELDASATYWLVLSASGDTYGTWDDSLSDLSGGASQTAGDGQGWSFESGIASGAYQVTGGPPVATPEPCSILLLGTGAAAVAGYCRARRRRAKASE